MLLADLQEDVEEIQDDIKAGKSIESSLIKLEDMLYKVRLDTINNRERK